MEVNKIFEKSEVFSTPKPVRLIERMIQIAASDDAIILDFFAGSASTAHGVIEYNFIKNSSLRYIVVQLPEPLSSKNKEHKAAYDFCSKNNLSRNIADIGKERIRRVVAKIKKENPEYKGDLGFKVFKLDSSNIRAWNPDRDDLEQTLFDHMEHLVEGRTEEDVLYELLLKRGVDLNVPIEEMVINNKTVYSIGYGVLFACLDKKITRDQVEGLAMGILDWHKELEPTGDTQVVFRDSAFDGDITKTNMTAILEQHGIAHVRSL